MSFTGLVGNLEVLSSSSSAASARSSTSPSATAGQALQCASYPKPMAPGYPPSHSGYEEGRSVGWSFARDSLFTGLHSFAVGITICGICN
jgi:hypothetical protein